MNECRPRYKDGRRGVRRGRGTTGQTRGNTQRVTRSSASGVSRPVSLSSPEPNVFCDMCNSNDPVSDGGIGCDKCDLWFQPVPSCTDLIKQAIDTIKEFGGVGIAFICTGCSCRVCQGQTSSVHDGGSIDQVFCVVKSLADSVAGLTSQVQKLLQHQTQVQSNPPNFQRESLYAEFREFDERKKRRDSLVMRGVDVASESEFLTLFGRVSNVLTGNSLRPKTVHCISTEAGPYRVQVPDFKARKAMLQNSSKFKEENDFKDIYISRDLTYNQKQERRAARATRSDGLGSPGNLIILFHDLDQKVLLDQKIL